MREGLVKDQNSQSVEYTLTNFPFNQNVNNNNIRKSSSLDFDQFNPKTFTARSELVPLDMYKYVIIYIVFLGYAIVLITFSLIYGAYLNVFSTCLAISLLLLLLYTFGWLVKNYNWKVNYSRKAGLHFGVFFFTDIIDTVLGNSFTALTPFWTIWFSSIFIVIFTIPIRSRFKFLEVCFDSFDRPEDRPFTLTWAAVQILMTIFVNEGFRLVFLYSGIFWDLTRIPLLILLIGDGLAEPIGIAYGKHTYETSSWFTDRVYKRSYEGSAWVFVSSIGVVFLYINDWDYTWQFIIAVFTIPLIATLSEAWAPHTLDNPIITLLTNSVTLVIYSLGLLVE